MPGLTVRLHCTPRPEAPDRFAAAQATMLHRPDDERVELPGSPVSLGYVRHPAYPVRRLNGHNDMALLVEGRIYNKDEDRIERELNTLARDIQDRPAAPPEAIRRWITETDGEYVVAMGFYEQRRLVIFSDPLGRLPLYHYADDEQFLIARECKFILQLKQPPVYDPIGCAESLWVGYPLGERTLFRDVRHAPAGALLEARVSGERVRTTVRSLTTVDFDDKDETPGHAGKLADALVDEFVEVCRLRGTHPDGGTNIVALSGGHDSRAVIAGMVRAGAPCIAFTGVHSGLPRHEVSGARDVAKALDVEWQPIEDARADLALHEELIRIKDGHNYTAVSHALANTRTLLSRWGMDATYVTGDAGGRMLPDTRPPHPVRSHAALLREIDQLYSYGSVPRAQAAALMGVSPDEMLEDLEAVLAAYPEASNAGKAVHYSIYERGRRFIFEGEDRTRFCMWQTTPFLSFPFFRTCMRVPDRLKSDRKLQRHFLRRISPAAARVPLESVGVGVQHPTYPARTWLRGRYDRLPWGVRRRVKARSKTQTPVAKREPELAAVVNDAIEAPEGLGSLMDRDTLHEVLAQANPTQFHRILTLALVTRLHPGP